MVAMVGKGDKEGISFSATGFRKQDEICQTVVFCSEQFFAVGMELCVLCSDI